MPAPATTAELLDLVYQSGLVDEAQLRVQIANLPALPPEPNELAAALVGGGFLTYFQAKQLVLGRWKRFHVGPYLLLELFGADTTGAFYLCEDVRLNRVVTVKVLPVVDAQDPNKINRFYHEARATAVCNHPNVAGAYEANQIENLHLIAMEFVDGTRLFDIVRRGPLDPVRAAHYIAQAATGLQHIHDQGIVHRNVKPAKLVLERTGTIKVCGLSIALFQHDTEFVDDVIRGTPNYIAPEQAVSSHVDGRADIYSLGCSAYHLLTGRPPFTGTTSEQKLVWHQIREPEPIRALRPEVPEELARVVEKMMGKAPESRYQSAAEVAAALAPWRATPIPPPPAEELPNYCPRVREAIARSPRSQPGTS